MNKPVKDIVSEILTIIGYPNDKDKFIEEFVSANYTDVLLNLTKKLPEELRKKGNLSQDDVVGFSPEDIEKVKQYITEEDLNNELERVTKEEIKKMVDNVLPKCNEEEKQKLNEVIKSLDEAPAAAQQPVASVSQDVPVLQYPAEVPQQTTPEPVAAAPQEVASANPTPLPQEPAEQ